MSSLRNAVKRITHKERAQPRARSHLGILEKKKDYVQRANDYHKKETLVKRLRQKAAMRNPDEFYFGMHNAEVRRSDGKHRKTQEAKQKEFDETIGHETIRVMKDQDLSYIRMQRAKDRKKVEGLQASLHVLAGTFPGQEVLQRKHTIFVDSTEDVEEFDAAKHFDTLPKLVERVHNRPKKEQVRKMALATANGRSKLEELDVDKWEASLALSFYKQKQQTEAERSQAQQLTKERRSAYREMEARAERIRTMEKAEAHLVTEKLVAGKGRKRKIQCERDGMPAQYVWRSKRLK